MENTDRFTEGEYKMLLLPWAVHEKGGDSCFRPEDEYVGDCIELAERGLLEQRVNDESGDLVFRWTPQAELALDISDLTETAQASAN